MEQKQFWYLCCWKGIHCKGEKQNIDSNKSTAWLEANDWNPQMHEMEGDVNEE